MTWRKWTREEMLAWFAEFDDETLEEAWCAARDHYAPQTETENFICRGCRYWVPGIECEAPESMGITSYKDCEKAVTADPLSWLSRIKDCFAEEGKEAYYAGQELDDCPYDDGTDGEYGWQKGWREASGFENELRYGGMP